jgi:hypothetical protein
MEDGRQSITPLKMNLNNIYNGLLTPAFNNYLNKNSTPTTLIQSNKTVRKPRVNFHSIDDIVNGGKSNKFYSILTQIKN